MGKLTFIDLFAGIGGFKLAFQNVGASCVFSSDSDKYCQITYKHNHKLEMYGDIINIPSELIPEHDILCGGFPCQPFSSGGRKHGFSDTRGTLFFEIERIIKDKKPKAFFLENVKNLKSHDNGETWNTIETKLKDLNYHVFAKVIDAKHFVPQHRERIFIIGLSKDYFNDPSFVFPDYPANRIYELKDIIEPTVDSKYTLSDKLWNYLQNRKEEQKAKGNGFCYGLIDLEKDTYTRTLSARYHKDGSEILIKQTNKNPRRLTPRECARLMGYPDSFEICVSDTQAYKQFGNSVVVPCIQSVAQNLVNCFNTLDYS